MHPYLALAAGMLASIAASPATAAPPPPGALGRIDTAAPLPEAGPLPVPDAALQREAAGAPVPRMAPATAGDDDLGVQWLLKREERRRWLRALAGLGLQWTDNAARIQSSDTDDFYFSGLLGAGLLVPVGNSWFADVVLGQQFIRYDKYSEFDFENTESALTLMRVFSSEASTAAGLSAVYRRYTDGDWSSRVYDRFGMALTFQHKVAFDRHHSAYIAATADWEFHADPSPLRRNEYSAQAGFERRLWRDWTATLFARSAWRDYRVANVDEWNHLAGVAVAWQFDPRARAEISYSYVHNSGSIDILDYEASTAAFGLNLRIDF